MSKRACMVYGFAAGVFVLNSTTALINYGVGEWEPSPLKVGIHVVALIIWAGLFLYAWLEAAA